MKEDLYEMAKALLTKLDPQNYMAFPRHIGTLKQNQDFPYVTLLYVLSKPPTKDATQQLRIKRLRGQLSGTRIRESNYSWKGSQILLYRKTV